MSSAPVYDWPSTPGADGKVPTLIELLSSNSPVVPHVQVLATKSAELAKRVGGKMDAFQVAFQTPMGPISLPGVLLMPDKSVRLLYSHAGEWTNDDINRLLRWTAMLRVNEKTSGMIIEVLTDPQSPPNEVLEIVDHGIETQLGIRAQMFLDPGSMSASAKTALQTLKFAANLEVTLDRAGMVKIDAFVQEKFGPLPETWYYRGAMMAMFGSVLGEAVVQSHGGQWVDPPPMMPPWMKQVRIGAHTLNPLGRASKFLRDPNHDPLTEFFDLSTPVALAKTAADVQKKLEG